VYLIERRQGRELVLFLGDRRLELDAGIVVGQAHQRGEHLDAGATENHHRRVVLIEHVGGLSAARRTQATENHSTDGVDERRNQHIQATVLAQEQWARLSQDDAEQRLLLMSERLSSRPSE